MQKNYKNILRGFLETWEVFRANPYWDEKRYSWGYGTPAPSATGTISRSEAWSEALQHLNDDLLYLFPLITRPLNQWQWAALLSFSYNEGTGNADNLIENINSGDDAALREQWNKYVYAGNPLTKRQNLVDRRAAEFDTLWMHG